MTRTSASIWTLWYTTYRRKVLSRRARYAKIWLLPTNRSWRRRNSSTIRCDWSTRAYRQLSIMRDSPQSLRLPPRWNGTWAPSRYLPNWRRSMTALLSTILRRNQSLLKSWKHPLSRLRSSIKRRWVLQRREKWESLWDSSRRRKSLRGSWAVQKRTLMSTSFIKKWLQLQRKSPSPKKTGKISWMN